MEAALAHAQAELGIIPAEAAPAIARVARLDLMDRDRLAVQLSSCITKSNYHGPPCPHLDYLKELICRAGLDCREDTVISAKAEQRRRDGVYR